MDLLFTIIIALIIIYLYNWGIFLINYRTYNIKALINYLSPIVEEFIKTILGFVIANTIIGVHVGIGIAEGLKDLYVDRSWGACMASIIGHSFFGSVTLGIYRLTGYLILGIILGAVVHIGWNSLILSINQEKTLK
ncbi:hypothetical protein [Natranaerobius thermophilus]|uniref:Uncharacterized protein n=1 Tax=Natranaerobius thermophilus (strain ATCC BAA-1301 / DSM 18059 / JW/NM-WN-LF) TaxID=457570 RepID=B2A3N9_NATTJ|nr:hypothetical protein [Natranaerobius thermophilus]ACB83665.1 conserved hypothetical protein [Natranaerobius thermophilus JW/NM-WN-LF]